MLKARVCDVTDDVNEGLVVVREREERMAETCGRVTRVGGEVDGGDEELMRKRVECLFGRV